MKSLLALILVGALSPALAVEHTVFHSLELDYKLYDGFPIRLQCFWQASSVAQMIDNKNKGMSKDQALTSIKIFGEDPVNMWAPVDRLFMVDSVEKIYADDVRYTPKDAYEIVNILCLGRRSAKPINYI